MSCLQGIYRDETLVEMQTLLRRGRRLTLAQDPVLTRQREKKGKLRKFILHSRNTQAIPKTKPITRESRKHPVPTGGFAPNTRQQQLTAGVAAWTWKYFLCHTHTESSQGWGEDVEVNLRKPSSILGCTKHEVARVQDPESFSLIFSHSRKLPLDGTKSHRGPDQTWIP